MSTGTKRPIEEQLLHCTASSSSRLPKRRKQSTPVRIPGGPHDPGPDNNDTQQNPNQNENYTVDFAALEQDETNDENFETIYADDSTSQSAKENDESTKKDNVEEDEEGILEEYKPNRVDNNCHKIEPSLINNKGFIEKYKEHLNDQESVYDEFEIKKNNIEIDRLNAYRIKAVTEPKGNNNGKVVIGGDASSYEDGSNPGEQNVKKYNNMPNSVIVDRSVIKDNDKETSDAYNNESITDEQNKQLIQQRQHSSPSDSDKYATVDRYPCRKCGIMFQNIEQLKVHFETEHNIERNGKQDCKLEPYESEENSSGTNAATSTPLTNIPDPRLEAWGTDFQAKMADLYKNALGFQHDIPKESLPPNFNPLCPPFPLFPTGVPPQRPMMEPIRIFNPEAYCELCSKEFCNKYFLKTHKANKHGIYENNPSGSGSEGLNLDPSFMPNAFAASALKFKNNMMLADYAKSYEVALLASQRHKAKIQKMVEEAREMEKNNTEAQTLAMHMNMNSRQLALEDVKSSSDDNTIPENFIYKGDRSEQDEPFMTPTPRKLSPDSSKRARESGFSTDILRRLGVINPEAFCKICCKEYCNKYFLKTHKIKRHGLLPSPTDKLAMKEQIQQMSVGFERKDGQTSPLNLIMTEESTEKRQTTPEELTPVKIQPNREISNSLNNSLNQMSNSNGSRPLSTQSIESTTTEGKREVINEDSTKSEIAKQSPTTIFISEDLQKLQTMISQLNDLSVNKIVECYVCKKEFDNNYVLQFHMMSDHGISIPGSVENYTFPSGSGEDISGDGTSQQKPICTICDKEFPSIMLLKKHVEEFHTPKMNFTDPKSSMDSGSSDKEANQQRERRASMSLTPTNSYCEICNKELCNKYFMKTHMQRMHGIEIENGTQIGGVICDICNKELCSKYFLRVHKHNTHGIVEPGAPLPQMRSLSGEPPEVFNPPPAVSPLKPPSETSILSNRFIAHFIEVCPFCSRRFRTSKWLKAHLLSDHGKAGIDKWKELEVQYKIQAKNQQLKANKLINPLLIPEASNMSLSSPNMNLDLQERLPHYNKLVEPKLLNMFNMNNPDIKTYNCSYCPFTTSILSFLYVHEKSHIQGPEMDILCPMCPESFSKPEALQFHIITSHSLPEWRDRSGIEDSPTSVRESLSRQKTPELIEEKVQPITGNGKAEIFDCYECDFKTCSFGEMESHLRSQHYAVRESVEETCSNLDAENNIDEERRKPKIPAIYAVPRDIDIESNETSITMQPFVIEENSPDESGGKFVPSVVFLPVRRRATGAITISFNLTPA